MLRKDLLRMVRVVWFFNKLKLLLFSKFTTDIRHYGWFCSAYFCNFTMGVTCLSIQRNNVYVPLLLLFVFFKPLLFFFLLFLLPWWQSLFKFSYFINLFLFLIIQIFLNNFIIKKTTVFKELKSLICFFNFKIVLSWVNRFNI